MKILFCPSEEIGNTLEERYYEALISDFFECRVDSLIFHQGDTVEEIFDLIDDCDMLVLTVSSMVGITLKTMSVIKIATALKKSTFIIDCKSIGKEE